MPPKKFAIRLDPKATEPAYEQVRQSILAHITAGRLATGDRLPPVRTLSSQLGVAYATAARAVRSLVEDGVLEARRGAGTRVASSRGKRMQMLGVVGFAPFVTLMQTTRFQAQMLNLVQDAVIARDKMVVFCHYNPHVPIERMFHGLDLVDGLLIIGGSEVAQVASEVRNVIRRNVPAVVIGQRFDDPDIPMVYSDNYGDSFRAVEILAQRGHRSIAIANAPRSDQSLPLRQRVAGALAAIKAHDLPWRDTHLVSLDDDAIVAEQLRALRPRPTAIFMPSGIERLAKAASELAGTPLELGTKLLPAVYDENLWHVLAPLGIDFISVEQRVSLIAARAVDLVLEMLESHAVRVKQERVAAKLVDVTAGVHRPLA